MINKYFFQEMEKRAFPIMSALMAAQSVFDVKNTAKQNIQNTRLEPLKQQEKQLQLPGSNAYDFEGGKRIDSQAITAQNKY